MEGTILAIDYLEIISKYIKLSQHGNNMKNVDRQAEIFMVILRLNSELILLNQPIRVGLSGFFACSLT
jgi:hypothetical protein